MVAPGDLAREKHLKTFRAEIQAATASGDRSRIETLLDRPKQLGLDAEDAALECEHLAGLLAAADVSLLPSLENDTTRDIVPMKVYEYLAAGKPVVASRLPGLLAEFGQDGGIVYGEHPVDVLTRAVELRCRPAEARLLGMMGRRMAEQNADWEKTTDCFEGLLRRAVEEMAKGTG